MVDKKGITQHISRRFNEQLDAILNRVMRMGGLVEQQLNDALVALVDGDEVLAGRVIDGDDKVNAFELELDEACMHVLARRQPAASDLRLVIAVIKAITDLERIGDEAERIARMARRLPPEARQLDGVGEVAAIGRRVSHMLHGALDCFARMDAAQAVRVAEEDVQTDVQYEAVLSQLMRYMEANPSAVSPVMDIIWSARALERIGDRSRNICEYVVYFVKGKDVRHSSFATMAEHAGVPPKPST